MRLTFAIGDVHGCLEPLNRLLDNIRSCSSSGGTVVFLGDYVDRGPDSKGVIDLIRGGPPSPKWEWVALKGNHEDMMVGAVAGEYETSWWIGNGGSNTLGSYENLEVDPDHLLWARDLPLNHADKHRIFVHADMDGSIPFDEQTEQRMLWARKPPNFSGDYWGKHLVHGHTPLHEPTTIGNRTNVDSGCVFGGKLSCAVFDDDLAGGPIEFISVRS